MKQKQNKKLILWLLALAQFLVILDSVIVNVALPAIKTSLGFDATTLQWVVTAYVLTFGGFLMLGGRAADLFGRRRVLVGSIIVFSIMSLLIGLSQSSTMFIVLRSLQGLAAAFMSPAALSILLTTFKEGNERNKALSLWGALGAGGAAVGVMLGGLITQTLGWEWNFFINVPLGFLAAWGLYKIIPAHSKEESDKKLDISGALLVTSGLVTLVYALTQAEVWGWADAATWSLFGLSAAFLVAFFFNESKVKHPLMPLSIFQLRNVMGGNVAMMPIMAGAFGMFFFASLYIQNVLQYSPILTGLSFIPVPIIIGVISTNAPRLLQRFSLKQLMITGTILLALGNFYLSLIPLNGDYFINVLPGLLIMAVGMGLSFVSVTIAATSGVPARESGLASGMINTSQQVGGALGLAILSSIAAAVTASHQAAGNAFREASLYGYKQVFLWAGIFIVFGLLAIVFIVRTKKQQHESAKTPETAPEPVALH
ncbi:MAG TPA: MFS transporter [Candidatus Saccharimonadales bacterium]